MNDMQDVLKDFLVESYENLDQLDRDLVSLEQDPHSQETLKSIFRTIHTIKGTCGFLGLSKLESVTHVGENLLSKLRDGEITIDPQITTSLLALIDAVRSILGNIETSGEEGSTDYSDLVQTLVALQEMSCQERDACLGDRGSDDSIEAFEVVEPSAEMISADSALRAGGSGVSPKPMAEQPSDDSRSMQGNSSQEGKQGGVSESTIRVDVGLLDKLMNRVGELVLARNQILQFAGGMNDSVFLSTSQRLNLITTELQEGVMKTRMQPIGNVWSKFPRVVRDLAVQCGKKVRIEMEGRETELDKTIVEAIKDPLTHLVRNSVDHGIESPENRRAAGKPEEGCLCLRAFHEGGQVNIEISDDGGGLNIDRIKSRAIERGLITHEQALRMSDRELAHMIFAPGFSTAAKVTNVSGRGVGMDVVKTNIEKIGGSVDIQSTFGQGTTVKLKIPLTLAIIPALIVTCGGDRFAIPQVSLLELVRLEGEQARRGIEQLYGAPVYRLRGALLPIVYLSKELGLTTREDRKPTEDEKLNIVVLRADDRQFGLVVDSINDTEEIVVKPLSKQLKGLSVYAGTTIMGDGKVALILDVLGMAHRASVVSGTRDRTIVERGGVTGEKCSTVQSLLVLEVGKRRFALPISLVSRLEEIDPTSIELADNQEVIQYRGDILPLHRLSNVFGVFESQCEGGLLPVVVYSDGRHQVGLIVDRIADIVETRVDLTSRQGSDYIVGSAVIQNKVTDLLDLGALMRRFIVESEPMTHELQEVGR
jgi:two-component system, chemotaxis family, sensor kinase CheA